MTNDIVTHSNEEHTNSIAAYLPGGRLFEGATIQDTNFRKMLKGFADELITAEGYLKSYQDEYDINETTLFIDEWESSVGIPDACFLGPANVDGITGRRRDVLVKLASLGVQTTTDFENLAAIFGVNVQITSGSESGFFFPAAFPAPFFGSQQTARFAVVVKFISASALIDLVECLFSLLVPANCVLVVIPPPP